MEGAVKVLIVDDQSLIRQGLSVLLASEGDIQIVGEAGNGLRSLQNGRAIQSGR